GAFAAHPETSAAPFTIMIPPPNVTGSLHMGHALTFTIQDALIRWRRMQGRDALWQPGTDHAGIATQMVVERLLAEEQSSRRALGRAAFVERVWRWREESGGTITRQLRRLGASLDWPRERFTMDRGLSEAVRRVFVTLYRDGLIYRARRLVNWDPKFQSAISDLEVESRETKGTLWYVRYPLADEDGKFITVATTRPETMLGDVAVAVHPDDERYRALLGRTAILPLTGRRIPIIADAHSDPEKGTGAVKITPAHDFGDFKVGERHGLPMPSVLDLAAKIRLDEIKRSFAAAAVADHAFLENLAGEDRFAAREAIVQRLEALGLIEKSLPQLHQVPHGDRSGVPIEPLLTWQWFCNAVELAKPAIAAVESGQTVFVPKQWENTFFAWMRNLEPWCISRQLWWGHRIPAWYGPDQAIFVADNAGEAELAAAEHYGEQTHLRQDEDVLDTWFSSALWPFSTLGWPQRTPELERYYPGDVLVTGFDIIFFWVARMMMMGHHFMRDVPFRTVYIHGLVRDPRGQKMSKSKGNIIDPLALIDRYGADALRFAIIQLTGPGRDIKLGAERVETARSFITKIWNAARFSEMNGIRPDPAFRPEAASLPLCRWVLDAANRAIGEATAALEAFRFDEYGAICYRFAWHLFCDWFVELAKPSLTAGGDAAGEVRATAAHVLGTLLRLLHPAIPFASEELWDRLGYGASGSLILASWPEPSPVSEAPAARQELDWLVRLIGEIRTVRAEMNVPPAIQVPILLKDAKPATLARAGRWREAIGRLARVSEIRPLDGVMPRGVAQAVVEEATVILPLAEIVDLAAERARLDRERGKVGREAERLKQKLADTAFISRAPEDVVLENRERLTAAEAELARLEAALRRIA
ncbi:MAG: valine--tRNA ligase, partial [Acetobacteraceae bacterium]